MNPETLFNKVLYGLEPTLGGREEEYRKKFLETDRRLCSGGFLVWASVTVLFIFNDYFFFGVGVQFWKLIAWRGLFVVSVVTFVCLSARLKQPEHLDWTVFALTLSIIGLNLYIMSTRPSGHSGLALEPLFIIWLLLVFPGSLNFRVFIGFLASMGTLSGHLLYDADASAQMMYLTAVSLIVGTVLGLFVSVLLNNSRRNLFLAQAMVQESELRYRELFEHSSDLVYTQGLDGCFTSVNSVVRPLLGYTVEEFCTRHFRDIVAPQFLPVADGNYLRKVREEAEVTGPYEILAHAKDGTPVWLEIKSRLMTRGGESVGIHGTAREVTDRKRAEEALRKSEANLRSLFEAITEPVFLLKRDGEILAANEQFAAKLGTQRTDLVGKCVYDYLPPDVAQQKRAWVSQVIGTGKPLEIEDERMGSYVRHSLYPVFNVEGAVDRLAVYTKDLTLKKKAEEALHASEELYRALVETTSTGYVIIDHQGKVLDANPEYVRITGSNNVNDMRGRAVVEWIAEHDRPRHASEVEKCFVTGFIRNLEIDYVDSNGNIVPVEINATLTNRKGGRQIITLCRDIRERKNMEHQLRASLREKEVLLREIHHRVKNNLHIISSLFELEAIYGREKPPRQIVSELQDRVRAMAILHEHLYRSSRLDSVDAGEYIRSLTGPLWHYGSGQACAIDLKVEVEDVRWNLDTAIPVGLIIVEIVTNAFKHAFVGRSEGAMTISVREIGEQEYELIAGDNGMGIPEHVAFPNAGTLGLDIIHALADQLHADVRLERRQGTQYRFRFRALVKGAKMRPELDHRPAQPRDL